MILEEEKVEEEKVKERDRQARDTRGRKSAKKEIDKHVILEEEKVQRKR